MPQKRFLAVVSVLLVFVVASFAQPKKTAAKGSGGPDKAYLQKIWMGGLSRAIDARTVLRARTAHFL